MDQNNTYSNSSMYSLTSNEKELNKIGIIDFRYILKRSNAMKVLGNKFLLFEKKINMKFKQKQVDLKNKEEMIKKDKIKLRNKRDIYIHTYIHIH